MSITSRGSITARRARLVAAAVVVVAVGLAVATRVVGLPGALADPAGDAMYAALVYLVLACCAPRARWWLVAALAFGACAAVEVAQLTGVPALLVAQWSPLRYVLGTTFAAPDLVAYAVGAAGAGVVDRLSPARRPPG